ncbi:trypsin-like serine peptidase [Actinoplanes sp. NPDC020271]|uniref:trypsin-like serine peptidase n=1 Tax=Actinoplanes sp. NPDC020271 TaxID=3363896 RepID=UPI0037AE53DC
MRKRDNPARSSEFRDRIVEVIADLGPDAPVRYRYGSGCVVAPHTVLTAGHVVHGAVAVKVRNRHKESFAADLAASLLSPPGSRLDMAIIALAESAPLLFRPLRIALVDRACPDPNMVRGCETFGYPDFMEYRSTPDSGMIRDVVHVRGDISLISSSVDGLLTLQVSAQPRPLPEGELAAGRSEWSGMSGAPVFAGDHLIGVVTEHRLPQGTSSISVSALADLLATDETTDAFPDAAEWWTRLHVADPRRLRRVPRSVAARRRTLAAAFGAAVFLIGSVPTAGTVVTWLRQRDDGHGPEATSAFRTNIDWDELAPDDPATGAVRYRTVFATSADGWPRRRTGSHVLAYANNTYAMTIRKPGTIVTVRSPVHTSGTHEIVSGTATIRGGAGSWGVWCRGSGRDDADRYEFRLSHSGAVEIVEPEVAPTGWVKINGLDMSKPVTLTAHCDDSDASEPVHLRLAVNGRAVIDYAPRGRLLGPGNTGFQAYSFGDVSGGEFVVDLIDFQSGDS